jgi:hypothetical protein
VRNVVSSAGHQIFGFFTTREARTLRAVCREMRDAVAAHAWADARTVIRGRLALWRACFPRAAAANVSGRGDLGDADLALLCGVRTLDVSYCWQRVIMAVPLAHPHLRGMAPANSQGPGGPSEAAFARLGGVRHLRMRGCNDSVRAAAERAGLPVEL